MFKIIFHELSVQLRKFTNVQHNSESCENSLKSLLINWKPLEETSFSSSLLCPLHTLYYIGKLMLDSEELYNITRVSICPRNFNVQNFMKSNNASA